MKKKYFAPELITIGVEPKNIIMSSADPENVYTYNLGDDTAKDKFFTVNQD